MRLKASPALKGLTAKHDYSRFYFVLFADQINAFLRIKWVLKQQGLRLFGLKLIKNG